MGTKKCKKELTDGRMWNKIAELAEQNQFELLIEKGKEYKNTDLRLVYLMNDAVESFVVFKNATLTGEYIEEFEGDIWIDVPEAEERQMLILHQEKNVVSLFFDDLDFELHLYDYSRVGHFWVKGYEYLRQLEFKIAILGDKYQYIGTHACTAMEQELAQLVHFPPLSYLFYAAVPDRYIVPREDPWHVSKDALTVMKAVAGKAGDRSFVRWLKLYERIPTRWMAAVIARKLHRTRHIGIAKELMQMFREACRDYPRRREVDPELLQKVEAENGELFIEEPFAYASDGIEQKLVKGIWEYGSLNTRIRLLALDETEDFS